MRWRVMNRIGALTCTLVFATACAPQSDVEQDRSNPLPVPTESKRKAITAGACEGGGGQVIGDPGDGSVHRAGFRCPNGEPPLGVIGSEPDEPIMIEGAVCCGQ